tara:strand:- start:1213 stop:1515 length:303 start_codon:yes stop_codon:yes gene_type:complete
MGKPTPTYTCSICGAKQSFDGLEENMIKSIRHPAQASICEPCSLAEQFVRRSYTTIDKPLSKIVSAKDWKDMVLETRNKTTDDLLAKARKNKSGLRAYQR